MDAVLVRQHRILHALDPLDHQREVGDLADPGNRVPVEVGRDGAREGFGDPLDRLAFASDDLVLFADLSAVRLVFHLE